MAKVLVYEDGAAPEFEPLLHTDVLQELRVVAHDDESAAPRRERPLERRGAHQVELIGGLVEHEQLDSGSPPKEAQERRSRAFAWAQGRQGALCQREREPMGGQQSGRFAAASDLRTGEEELEQRLLRLPITGGWAT